MLRKVDAGEVVLKNGFRICAARYDDEDILLVETGPGKKRAERGTESVLQDYPISGIVSLGFAGALNEKLSVGDLVLCQTLSSFMMPMATDMIKCDSKWASFTLARAKQKGIALKEGSGVTVRMPVCDTATKKALGKEFSAVVAEMESYWIGRIARSRGIPFLCIRAISDTLSDHLPPFDRLTNVDGSWQKGKAALYFLARPWRLARLAFFYRNVQRAAESLTQSFEVAK